jgi:hypothetical protein
MIQKPIINDNKPLQELIDFRTIIINMLKT